MVKILKNSLYNKTLLMNIKSALLIMVTITTLFSCKSSEVESDVMPEGTTSVKVNISDVVFNAVHEVTNKASINQSNGRSNVGIQQNTVSLNKDYDLIAELSPELPSSNRNALSATGVKKAANVTETDKMAPGVRYKIVAYENDGRYATEKNYVRGQENQVTDFFLDGGKTYRFVVYSVNSTSELPSVTFADNGNKTINTSSITVKGNLDFLYAIQNKTLVGGVNNEVNVILKHQFSQITTTVDASATGYNITAINAVINSHHETATIALLDGTITRSPIAGDARISFPALGTQTVVGTPTLINANVTNGSFTIKSITIGPLVQSSDLVIFTDLVITPGVKYNMKVKLVPKDAYLNHANQSAVRIGGKIWMRYNLGADNSLDPDQSPGVAGLFGSFYQWGKNVPVALRNETKVNSNWYNSNELPNNTWNSGTEAIPVRTAADPCPAGFRVPTATDFQALIDNTIGSNIGNWTKETSNLTNVSVSKILTSKRKNGIKIVFPSQGLFNTADNYNPPYNSQGLQFRGNTATYPTSTSVTLHKMSEFLAEEATVSIVTRPDRRAYKFRALPVRCIAL